FDAVENHDHIVFLHHVQEGPASQSFGIQVAKLAGLPAIVIQQAKEKLATLEQPIQSSPSVKKNMKEPITVNISAHPVLGKLKNIELDSLSPRDALTLLYQLRNEL
ncbi:MAG: MutS-related protein, partial [Gammaproteobacteria bacterium]